jgi:DNA-binding transcriptional LysR family regulator
MVDLSRGDIDIAVRYLPENRGAGTCDPPLRRAHAAGREPALLRRAPPLTKPADLAHHVLLHLDDPDGPHAWLNWPSWLNSNGAPDLKPAGSLRFSIYDQVVQAAVSGQGIALGRIPMIAEHLRDGRLVSPFPKRYDSARGYYVLVAPHGAERADVSAFVRWLPRRPRSSARPWRWRTRRAAPAREPRAHDARPRRARQR